MSVLRSLHGADGRFRLQRRTEALLPHSIYLPCERLLNVAFYLQLIGFDVSATVRVILPPGLKQKGEGKPTNQPTIFTTETLFCSI